MIAKKEGEMKTKLTLNNTEQQQYNLNVKRLMSVGVIPREDEPSSEPQMLSVERTGGPMDSFIHATRARGYGIVVWVRIVVLKSGVNLCGCEVTPRRWDDARIQLVEATDGIYSYTRIGGVEYPRTDVLNPWISNNRYLSRGKVLQGVVMAQSPVPLPAWCDNRISIEADLIFLDQFDNAYPLDVELRVMRDTERNVERPKHSGLFGSVVNASVHGAYVEKHDLSDHDGISRKNPSMPQPNDRRH
jgi:hypothetical protein